MAIINCPSCKERISDKAKICGYCHYDMVRKQTATGLSEEHLASKAKMAHIKRRYSLQMQAMAGIILFLLGALLWYFGGRGFTGLADFVELSLTALGAIWYLLTRIRLVMFMKQG